MKSARESVLARNQVVEDSVRFILTDIGGTHARLAWFDSSDTSLSELQQVKKFSCAEFADMAQLLRCYLQQLAQETTAPAETTQSYSLVLASAGILHQQQVRHQKLQWPIDLPQLQQQCGFQQIYWLNDFSALAWAQAQFAEASLFEISAHRAANSATASDAGAASGPSLIIGPGTGLGVALYSPQPGAIQVLASEAGHLSLRPFTTGQAEIMPVLEKNSGRLSYDSVLSGPGLVAIYQALAQQQNQLAEYADAAQISQAAIQQTDALAQQSLAIFSDWLAHFCAEMAICFQARQIYLAGSIPAHIAAVLQSPRFAECLLDKGVFRPFLQSLAIHVINHGELALHGARQFALVQLARLAQD